MRDRHGNIVVIGDVIRVLEIAPETLTALTDDERPHIEAMLYGEFVIDAMPEQEKVSVTGSWQEDEGLRGYGRLYLRSHEFERVRTADTK